MLTMDDISEVTVEPTTDTSLRAYSHSMLNAISTCPTKGLVTYHSNKVMNNTSRAMALEAGSAAHEAYAAMRLWQLGRVQGLSEHEWHHGVRLFGQDRYESMREVAQNAESDRLAALRYSLEAFYTSGFYDDPADKYRTFTNIEEALIAYINRFDFTRDVWIQDSNDPECLVGIEIPLDVTVSYITAPDVDGRKELRLRFIGTADGVTVRNGELRLEENKTASRLGEAWAAAWQTSHQQTGYLLALSTILGMPLSTAAVHGMAIPLPRSYDAGGLMTEVVTRETSQFQDFLAWVLHVVQIIDIYGDDPTHAPKYTNACNNYFRACSLIPICASDDESREEFFDMMVDRNESPTEAALSNVDGD